MKKILLTSLLVALYANPLWADKETDQPLDELLFQKMVEIRNQHDTEIRIIELTGINQAGQPTLLYHNDAGYITKAGEIGSIAEQLDARSIADGSYKRLSIKLDTRYNSEALGKITKKDTLNISGYITVSKGNLTAEGMQDKD